MPHHKKGAGWLDDIGRVFSPIADKVAPVLIDKGVDLLTKKLSGGRVKHHHKKGEGFWDDFAGGFKKGFTGVMDNPISKLILDKGADTLVGHLAGGKIHHHHIPVNLSMRQIHTLRKGGAITLNPASIMEGAEHILKLLPQQGKKVLNAIKNNRGVRVALKAGEDLIHRITGKGFFDDIGRVFSPIADKVAPVLIDKGLDMLTKKLSGGRVKKHHKGKGFFDGAKERIDRDMMNNKNKIPAVMPRIPIRGVKPINLLKGEGFLDDIGRVFSPIADKVAPVLIDKAIEHFMGSGIHGIRSTQNLDMPIQLGSPYQHIGSPAMHPFIPTRGIQSYNPLPHTIGSGIMPAGVMGNGINPPGNYTSSSLGNGILPAGSMRYGRGKR